MEKNKISISTIKKRKREIKPPTVSLAAWSSVSTYTDWFDNLPPDVQSALIKSGDTAANHLKTIRRR